MSEDRLSEFWSGPESRVLDLPQVGSESAFVLCPGPVLQVMSPWMYAQSACIYRLAYEQAQAQVARPLALRIAAFSVN